MARKQTANIDEQISQLAAGCRSISVSGSPWTPAPKTSSRKKLPVDPRYADRPDFTDLPSVFEVVPVKTKNPCNNLEPWHIVSKRSKAEHEAVQLVLMPHREKLALLALGCTVTLTRISRKKLDKHDGLAPALKRIRDAVAMALLGGTKGQHDEDERIEWRFEQRTCGNGVYGVTILIEPRTGEQP